MNTEELKNKILEKEVPKNVAIILDGNGRWAKKRGMPRTYGHSKGIETLVEISETCKKINIKNLLVYAFSTENWNRPKDEVDFLMKAFVDNLTKYKKKMIKNEARVKIIGEKNNLNDKILAKIEEIEDATKEFNEYTLYICFNYGGHEEIVHAARSLAKKVSDGIISVDDINNQSFENELYTNEVGPIDLLIRTSGEQRTSNFLPWQLAYAEFVFTPTYWPDFHKQDLYETILEYQSRSRRFGGLEKEDVK